MDAPFEDLPIVAQKRIIALKSALAGSRPTVDKQSLIREFLERIQKQFPFSFTGDPTAMDAWVIEQLRKDAAWIADMTDTLYEEGLETRKSALGAQICSSIGKSLPSDFQFSQEEKDSAWNRAYDSVQSQAKTFNEKVPGWVQKARADWVEGHGSLKGLNRYVLLEMTKKYVKDFDVYHDEQVAVTEFAHEWADEVGFFWLVNSRDAELEYYLSPATASDPFRDSEPICLQYSGQWLDRKDSELFPAHPNCVHYISETRVKKGALPLFFGIGFSRYNTENLPDC